MHDPYAIRLSHDAPFAGGIDPAAAHHQANCLWIIANLLLLTNAEESHRLAAPSPRAFRLLVESGISPEESLGIQRRAAGPSLGA